MYNGSFDRSGDYYTFKKYKIVKLNDKYGIENLSGDTIVDAVFDGIRWYKDENLVEFRLDSRYAICHVDEIINL